MELRMNVHLSIRFSKIKAGKMLDCKARAPDFLTGYFDFETTDYSNPILLLSIRSVAVNKMRTEVLVLDNKGGSG